MTTVINQHGRLIDGKAREEIIDGVEKDKDVVSFDGHTVIIMNVKTDEKCNKIIEVNI